MTEREANRISFRVRLFGLRGMTEPQALDMAGVLLSRDRSGDGRRVCVECEHMRKGFVCAKGGPLLTNVLQRCQAFGWALP